jgi:hypothetical protein
MYKAVEKYIRSCDTSQRVKASTAIRAPLQTLDVPTELWDSVSLDFILGLPKDKRGDDGAVTFTDRCSKSIVLAAVSKHITAADTARLFFDIVVCHHGSLASVVSDRDPRFSSHFWRTIFALCGTR